MKKILIIATVFVLSGCFLGYDRPDRIDHYSTNFFEKVYLDDKFLYEITSLYISDNVRYLDEYKSPEHTIVFYQDSKKECYLFSKSNKSLFDLENSFSKSNKKKIPVFLIEKDNIRIVTKEEYERIKPTLKPHPYDPSLCKPKPTDLK